MTSFAIVTVCVSLAASSSSADYSAAIGEGRQPRLTTNGGEAVYCIYGAGEDIFCVRSTDGGASFSQPAKVATLRGLMLGKRRGPRVAATGDFVVVSAISSETGDLVAWRSVDGAKTWSDAVRINDIDRACREGLHDMGPSADGSIAAVWLDLRNRETQLWASVSRDGGASWEPNRLVYRSPGGSICECCHPTVVASENTWSVQWRNNIEGHRDTYVTTSIDSLQTFSDAKRLGDAKWTLAACPMDGGDLALDQKGGWATWRREKTCYATNPAESGRELMLGPGEQPVVAMTSTGPAFAWISARPGDLMVRRSNEQHGQVIANQASDPDLLSLSDGTVLCCYESIEDGKSIVRLARMSGVR